MNTDTENNPAVASVILTTAPVVTGLGHHAYQNKMPMNAKAQMASGQTPVSSLKTLRVELALRAVVVAAAAVGVCISCVLYLSHAADKSSILVANTVTLTIVVIATAVDAWSSMRARVKPNDPSSATRREETP